MSVPFNWLCRVSLHPWRKWQITRRPLLVTEGEDYEIGVSIVQERECEACGLVQQRIVTKYI